MTSRSPYRRLGRFWADRPLALKGLVVVALPLLALLAALFSLYLASRAETRAEEDVRRAFSIQRDTYQVHALLAEAAAGARGYALTGQDRFLEPYRRAEEILPATLARLGGEIRDREVRTLFNRLSGLAARKREGLAMIIDLSRDPAQRDALQEALSANKRVLDTMRASIDQIQQREAILLEVRQQRVEAQRNRFLILTAISALAGLLGSLVAVYLFSTGIVRRVGLLEDNAERLAQGVPLAGLPQDADELGRLARRLSRASDLLRAREQDLRESEERFRLVVEEVRDYGIFALSPDGSVASWNLGAERIKGWKAEEILGQHFSAFYPPETRDELPGQMLERARLHGSAESEGWRIRRDGTPFWANVVITALHDSDGVLRGFAKVTRDMTERRNAEQALRIAREEAIAANRAKSDFLSRTSHELRTPLNAILGFGQLLEMDDQSLSEPHRTAAQQIVRAGRHLLSLINDLLDISSIEAGIAEQRIETLDTGELVREASELMAPLVATAGLRFEVDSRQPPLYARGDRRRVIQVLLNLVTNAVKYHRTGTRVAISCRDEDGFVKMIVEDDGDGVNSADAQRLFRAFDRLGQQERSKVEGTGLGLALSKSLVEAMGGAMGYEDARPGSRFWFTLPRAEAAPPAPDARDDAPAEERT